MDYWVVPDGIKVCVYVKTRAKKETVCKEAENLLIGTKAAPVKGKANKDIQKILGELFGVKRSEVSMISGETSTTKYFVIRISEEEFKERVERIKEC